MNLCDAAISSDGGSNCHSDTYQPCIKAANIVTPFGEGDNGDRRSRGDRGRGRGGASDPISPRGSSGEVPVGGSGAEKYVGWHNDGDSSTCSTDAATASLSSSSSPEVAAARELSSADPGPDPRLDTSPPRRLFRPGDSVGVLTARGIGPVASLPSQSAAILLEENREALSLVRVERDAAARAASDAYAELRRERERSAGLARAVAAVGAEGKGEARDQDGVRGHRDAPASQSGAARTVQALREALRSEMRTNAKLSAEVEEMRRRLGTVQRAMARAMGRHGGGGLAKDLLKEISGGETMMTVADSAGLKSQHGVFRTCGLRPILRGDRKEKSATKDTLSSPAGKAAGRRASPKKTRVTPMSPPVSIVLMPTVMADGMSKRETARNSEKVRHPPVPLSSHRLGSEKILASKKVTFDVKTKTARIEKKDDFWDL